MWFDVSRAGNPRLGRSKEATVGRERPSYEIRNIRSGCVSLLMTSLSPMMVSLVAIGLSSASIIMSAFSIRRQGIPDKFEVERRAMESLKQTNPDRRINGYKIAFITITTEGGLTNTVKKYTEGHIQGRTEVMISLENGKFANDFEGEYNFESSIDRPMPVTIKAPADTASSRVLTLETADSQEIYGLLQWLLIDIFPNYSGKLGPRKETSE